MSSRSPVPCAIGEPVGMILPPGKPRLLILGGTGQALSTAVHTLGGLGYDVTVAGRKKMPSHLHQETLFDRGNVRYKSLDALSPGGQIELLALAKDADLVIMGCEAHVTRNRQELDDGIAGVERFYRTMKQAGFTCGENTRRMAENKWPKRVVRIGSPPAELPLELIGGDDNRQVTLAQLRHYGSSHRCWQNPYFQVKVRLSAAAKRTERDGLDIVTAAPTAVISWFGDYGLNDPVVRFKKGVAGIPPLFTPSVLTNFVPGDVVGRGFLLAGIAGKTGESFQLAGADAQSAEMIESVLGASGRCAPPRREFSAERLDRQLRLLEGDSFEKTRRDLADYSVRFAKSLGLLAVSGGLAAPKITANWVAGAAAMLENGYDNSETLVLKAIGFEPWHVALLRQMQSRSANKICGLNKLIVDPRFDHILYPSEAEIRRQLPRAFAKQAEWLQKRGLLGA